MLEKFRYKAIPLLLTLGLGVTACGGHADGVAGLDLLDCEKGPKENTLSLGKLKKGASFTLAQSVHMDSMGRLGDGVTVTSKGKGFYEVQLDTGRLSVGGEDFIEARDDEPVFAAIEAGDSVTYSEAGESYEITAASAESLNGQEQPQLTVVASCDS